MRRNRSARYTVLAGLLALGIPRGVHAAPSAPAPSPPAAETNLPGSSKGDQAVVYTCAMDPDVVSDKPGKCPKCGMKLVAKTASVPAPAKPPAKK